MEHKVGFLNNNSIKLALKLDGEGSKNFVLQLSLGVLLESYFSIFISKSFMISPLVSVSNFFTHSAIWLISQSHQSEQVFSAGCLFFTIPVFSNSSVLIEVGTGVGVGLWFDIDAGLGLGLGIGVGSVEKRFSSYGLQSKFW